MAVIPLVVMFVGTPFQIDRIIVFAVFVFMVHTRIIVRVGDERLRYKPMH